jgi:hypothetical protein
MFRTVFAFFTKMSNAIYFRQFLNFVQTYRVDPIHGINLFLSVFPSFETAFDGRSVNQNPHGLIGLLIPLADQFLLPE